MDLKNVLGYQSFRKISEIDKGWSIDKKYYIETSSYEKLLLRVTDIARYEIKKHEYELMKEVYALDVAVPKPLDFGTCNNEKSVYILLEWCDGEPADMELSKLSTSTQYSLGVVSGTILKRMHSINAPTNLENWSISFARKINKKIKEYHECGINFEKDDYIIEYIKNNSYLLEDRLSSFQHGDYHVGNMVISKDHKLSIIDFNRMSYGDPWEEFNRIVWSASVSPHFATGQINGYFNDNPPLEFFKLLALYISVNTLSSIPWAIQFGDEQINVMIKQSKDVLNWFDDMKNPIPTWYIK